MASQALSARPAGKSPADRRGHPRYSDNERTTKLRDDPGTVEAHLVRASEDVPKTQGWKTPERRAAG